MTAESTIKAGSAVVEVMAGFGVRRLYTVPGESFLEVLDTAEQHPDTSLISVRHESGAAFMAEADAKLTGIPAVAMATRGVGASNLAIGVHTAHQDSTPMLVLLGQVESPFLGREAFQEVDLAAFYSPITKWAATVHRADRLPEFVAKGLRIATSGRPGPVMLAVPSDLFAEDIPTHLLETLAPTVPVESTLGSKEARSIAQQVTEARAPVLITGSGTSGARAEVIAFAETFGVGVYTAFRRQDTFPNEHPQYLGHLTLSTPPDILRPLQNADLVLVMGCRLSEVTTQGYELPKRDCTIIQIDRDPAEVGAVADISQGIVADARVALSTITEHAPHHQATRDWTDAHQIYLKVSTIPEVSGAQGIDPARVVSALQNVLPPDTILTNDAGNFSAFLHLYWRYQNAHSQLAPTNGAMGYGVPAAIAAKLANPQRCVVAVAGDGGFLMTGQEIETAVRCQAPILIVVFRNGMHGTIAMHQIRQLGRTAGTDISEVDLAGYARSLGAAGYTVYDTESLEPTLTEALDSNAVALVDVVTNPERISPTTNLSTLLQQSQA